MRLDCIIIILRPISLWNDVYSIEPSRMLELFQACTHSIWEPLVQHAFWALDMWLIGWGTEFIL